MRRTTINAAALLAVTALVGCSSGGPAGEKTAPASPTGSGATTEVAAAVTVGEHPYVWPCRLLTPTDAAELFPLTEEADFSELGRARSVRAAEMAEMEGTASGPRISSSCTYAFGDPAGTQAALKIDQFRTEEQATAQWRRFKKYGDGKLPRRSDPGSPFSEAEQAMRDARLAERVLTRAIDRVGDSGLDEPADPWFVQDEDWPTFLGPCSLLDDEAVELLFPGVPLEEVSLSSVDAVPDVNNASDSPAGRSHDSSCERSDVDGDHKAEVHVQYVAPQDEPEEVLDSYLSNLVFSDPAVRPGRVRTIRAGLAAGGLYDVDASYLLGTQRGDAHYFALLDRYVIELRARQVPTGRKKSEGGLLALESVDTYTLKTGMEVVVENVLAILGSSD